MCPQLLLSRHHLLNGLGGNFLRRLICRIRAIPFGKKQFKGFGKMWVHDEGLGLMLCCGNSDGVLPLSAHRMTPMSRIDAQSECIGETHLSTSPKRSLQIQIRQEPPSLWLGVANSHHLVPTSLIDPLNLHP